MGTLFVRGRSNVPTRTGFNLFYSIQEINALSGDGVLLLL